RRLPLLSCDGLDPIAGDAAAFSFNDAKGANGIVGSDGHRSPTFGNTVKKVANFTQPPVFGSALNRFRTIAVVHEKRLGTREVKVGSYIAIKRNCIPHPEGIWSGKRPTAVGDNQRHMLVKVLRGYMIAGAGLGAVTSRRHRFRLAK